MWSQSGTRLTIALALTLAAACSEDTSPTKTGVDPVGEDESDEEQVAPEDEDEPVVEEDEEAEPPPTTVRDARVPTPVRDSGPSGSLDAGPKPVPNEAGAVTGDSGPVTTEPDAGAPPVAGDGMCCDDGNCLCHGEAPSALTTDRGPYTTKNYALAGAGCVYYPDGDAKPPFAAVAISDGFGGTGGCGASQTSNWGNLYASWGIVTMIINTGSGDQPNVRGRKLTAGIAAFKTENTKSGSPLEGKLAGRYGTSGFSMGGGGTSYSAQADKTLLTSVAIMPWGPTTTNISVPTLVICGASDGIASCASHGNGLYRGIADSVPKMRVQVSGGHAGQPSAGGGASGRIGLAFQKVYLEGDTRWKSLLTAVDSEETNIK